MPPAPTRLLSQCHSPTIPQLAKEHIPLVLCQRGYTAAVLTYGLYVFRPIQLCGSKLRVYLWFPKGWYLIDRFRCTSNSSLRNLISLSTWISKVLSRSSCLMLLIFFCKIKLLISESRWESTEDGFFLSQLLCQCQLHPPDLEFALGRYLPLLTCYTTPLLLLVYVRL